MMRKFVKFCLYLGVAVIMLFIIFQAVDFKESKSAVNSKIVKIGAILPLSGGFSSVGVAIQQGMLLALSDFNDATLKVIYEDDQSFNNTAAVNACSKLVNIDKVDVIFTSVVTTAKAISSILNNNQVAGIVIWDSNKKIEGLGDYVFGMGFSTELAGEDMAEFSFNELKIKNVAVVSAHDEWSELIAASFVNKFEGLGGKVRLHERVNWQETNLRTVATKIKYSGSEGVYFPLYLQSLTSLVKQLREIGYDGKLLAPDSFTDNDIRILGELARGIYVTQVWLNNESFLEKYRSKFNKLADPMSLAFAALGYDAIKLVFEMIGNLKQRGVEITPKSFATNLINFSFEGMTGTTEFLSSKVAIKREPILIVEGDKFNLVKQY